ncbi:probable E3 ubiquitin-protein ligase bre1 [Bradysia coprophila]|uniref:probable E3 ubiquitin-protein ligase bre1 n=1 Tax=Bradysia coprophila TaxID=38358 RepID=UPI00187DB0F0|nr:probable E3 ubiquitin-protein ligase bre1 [Bradysia coprophila]
MTKTKGKGTKINEKSFISEIQSKRSLWDLSSPGYQRSSEKIVEWERVGNLFNITGAQASQKWVSLREKYRREKHKLSSEEEIKGTKRWVLFNHLKFLDDGPPQSKMIKLDEVEKPVMKVELAPKNRVYNNTSIRASAINSNNQMQIAKVDGNEIMITKEVVAKPIRSQAQQQQSLQLQQQQQQQQQDHQREVQQQQQREAQQQQQQQQLQQQQQHHQQQQQQRYIEISTMELEEAQQHEENNQSHNYTSEYQTVEEGQDPLDIEIETNYEIRCRAFGKYIGEELCFMQEDIGDSLISHILKLVLDKKLKK